MSWSCSDDPHHTTPPGNPEAIASGHRNPPVPLPVQYALRELQSVLPRRPPMIPTS